MNDVIIDSDVEITDGESGIDLRFVLQESVAEREQEFFCIHLVPKDSSVLMTKERADSLCRYYDPDHGSSEPVHAISMQKELGDLHCPNMDWSMIRWNYSSAEVGGVWVVRILFGSIQAMKSHGLMAHDIADDCCD